MKVGILGAGIVGVNTALQVQKEFPSAEITILAEGYGNETLSSGAAGIFRPGTNFSAGNADLTQRWITDSYNFYNDILQSEEAFRAGVMQVSGYIFSSKTASITKNHFLEKLLPIYRSASPEELDICPHPTDAWKFGAFFQTMVIESGSFLPWALEIFRNRGGTTKRQKVDSFSSLLDGNRNGYDYIFNCTGFGSKWLCNDHKLVPIRGQVYKVKAPYIKMFYYGDYDTYIIPGATTVTLGGTRQFDSYNTNVDHYDSAAIWDRCSSLVPSLKKSDIVREWVGLRPYRDPVRCGDAEVIQDGKSSFKKLTVIHEYGHGGYGITSAPGSAIHAVNALREIVRSGKIVNQKINIVSKL